MKACAGLLEHPLRIGNNGAEVKQVGSAAGQRPPAGPTGASTASLTASPMKPGKANAALWTGAE